MGDTCNECGRKGVPDVCLDCDNGMPYVLRLLAIEVEGLLASLREVVRSAPYDPIQQFCQGNCEIVGIGLSTGLPADRVREMGDPTVRFAKPFTLGRMKGTLTLSKVSVSDEADPKIAKLAQQQMFREVATEIEIPLANGCAVIIRAPEGGGIYPVSHSFKPHYDSPSSGGVDVEYEILPNDPT